jgi:hypothetical protein
MCALVQPTESFSLSLSVAAEATLGCLISSAVRLRDAGLKSSLLGRIACWDLLIATNGCQQDENSMQVVQVWTTLKEACSWSLIVSVWHPGVSESVSCRSQDFFCFGHSLCPLFPYFRTLLDTLNTLAHGVGHLFQSDPRTRASACA